MVKNSQTRYSRIVFAKELYKWGWRWIWAIIWVLPYGFASLYDLLQGQGYLPSNWPKLGQLIPAWVYFVCIVIGILVFIGLTFEGAYRIVKINLRDYKGNDDEISRVTKHLSELSMQIKGDNKNYSCMLIECAEKLAVGGITIDPATPPTRYSIVKDGAIELEEERPILNGMVHSQLLGFLRQLMVEGIVERKNIGTAPYYEETYYLTEFGRQVINRMKRLKEKKTYELDLVKLFHDGKDIQAKLKRVQDHWNASDQVTAESYFEAWFTDVSNALQNTKFISVWNDNKVVNYQKDSLSDYIEASDRALDRLDSIVQLASRKEGSQS